MKLNTPMKKDRCKVRGCKREYMTEGYCTEHYLKRLDAFEKASRKSKLIVR